MTTAYPLDVLQNAAKLAAQTVEQLNDDQKKLEDFRFSKKYAEKLEKFKAAEHLVSERDKKALAEAKKKDRKEKARDAKQRKKERNAKRYQNFISSQAARRIAVHGKPETCAICSKALTIGGSSKDACAWDHDHELEHLPEADQFRDWLCGGCNTGNGLFQDSSDLAYKHYLYLLKHEARRAELLQSEAA